MRAKLDVHQPKTGAEKFLNCKLFLHFDLDVMRRKVEKDCSFTKSNCARQQ